MRMPCVTVALAVCLSLAGCPSYTTPIAPPSMLTDEQQNFEDVFLASQDVLIDYGFDIDRRDRRRGEVTADPMLAMHLFELWRRDAKTGFDYAEGALQKIFIVPRVRIERMSPGSKEFIGTVTVERLRSSTPEKVPHSSWFIERGAPSVGGTGPRVTGGVPNFVSLGQDEALATRIAADIAAAATARRARTAYRR